MAFQWRYVQINFAYHQENHSEGCDWKLGYKRHREKIVMARFILNFAKSNLDTKTNGYVLNVVMIE